jgi:zinc and cadmium transporter
VLHLLPHAVMERAAVLEDAGRGGVGHELLEPVTGWLLAGFLAMFVLERFFCFHHHDSPETSAAGDDGAVQEDGLGHGHCRHHHHGEQRHRLTWTGAAIGLTVHSLIAGAALAASVASTPDMPLPGLATFLVIVLHKPFDSLTLGALMAIGDHSMRLRQVVNGLFALAIPAGAAALWLGLMSPGAGQHAVLSAVLAASAGMFLCIALSDLLPELQFHRHDRVMLTVALLLGLALAWGIARAEAMQHEHEEDHAGHDHARLVEPAPAAILTAGGRRLSSDAVSTPRIIAGIIPRPR